MENKRIAFILEIPSVYKGTHGIRRREEMEKKKGFVNEFKAFIMRGNVIDMAVGVIIGGAFQGIVSSLVNDIIMPLISIITGGIDFNDWKWYLNETVSVNYGTFITLVLNFLIMAFVIFMLVKMLNKVSAKHEKKPEPKAPTTKVCPYCKSTIPIDAVKCAHCTSDVE